MIQAALSFPRGPDFQVYWMMFGKITKLNLLLHKCLTEIESPTKRF